ncbi:MAG: BON domain-containing protein [Steroidobacteraceae bacterium]|jgi:hypothetical protein|nr:BON domain-containing protein [Steroidobacteraceae bacterium]
MSRNDESGRGATGREGERASRQYSEQSSGWFGHESGAEGRDRSRDPASGQGAYEPPGARWGAGPQADRVGQFGDRGSGRGGYLGGREGGSGGAAAEYPHQGGFGVTGEPYGHRGEGAYGEGGYGQRQYGQRGYGGQDRGPMDPQGEQRWGRPQTQYGRGAFGSGSSTYGMGASHWRQGDVAGGASPFGPGSQSGHGGARAYGAHEGYLDSGPQRSSGQMRRRGPKNYQRSDARLQEIISERLVDDPHIDSSDVDVHVKDGVVKLEGTVDDRRTKYQIEEMLEHIHGVMDVENHLKVRRGFLASLFGGGANEHRVEHAGRHEHAHDAGRSHVDETRTPPNDSWVYGPRSETERAGQGQDRWPQRSGSTAEGLESLKPGTQPNPDAARTAPGDATSTGSNVGTTHGSPLMASTADLRNASASGGTTAGTTTSPRNAGPGTNGGATSSGPVGVDRASAEKSAGETRPSRKST